MNRYIIVHYETPIDVSRVGVIASFQEDCEQPSESLICELKHVARSTVSTATNRDYTHTQFTDSCVIGDLQPGQHLFVHEKNSSLVEVYRVESGGWFSNNTLSLAHAFQLVKLSAFLYPTAVELPAPVIVNTEVTPNIIIEEPASVPNDESINKPVGTLTMSTLHREIEQLKSKISEISEDQSDKKLSVTRTKLVKVSTSEPNVLSQIISFNKDSLKHVDESSACDIDSDVL